MRKPLFLEGNEMNLYPDNSAVINHCMPSTIYAVEGRELNIYWDAILSVPFDIYNIPSNYRLDVTCTKGKQEDNRWTFTPVAGDAGSVSWTLSIYYQEILIKKITATLVTKAIATGSGAAKMILLGDSTSAGGQVVAESMNIFTGDAVTFTPEGSLQMNIDDAGGTPRAVKHEGRTGWKLYDYVATDGRFIDSEIDAGQITAWSFDNFTTNDVDVSGVSTSGRVYWNLSNSSTTRTIDIFKDAARSVKVASGSRTGDGVITLTPEATYSITGSITVVYTSDVSDGEFIPNPLYRNGAFNFSKYLSDNSITLSTGDWVMIHLGINDIFAYTTDATLYPAITTYLDYLDTLITAIHAVSANIKIGVLMLIPPCAMQEAFGDDYTNNQTQKRYSRNRFLLNQAILSSITSKAVANVYALPYGSNLDSVNNFPQALSVPNARNVSSVMKNNNGLHPDEIGYYQLADVLKANIKGFES